MASSYQNLQLLKFPSSNNYPKNRELIVQSGGGGGGRRRTCMNTKIMCSSRIKNRDDHIYVPNCIPDSSYVRIMDTTLRDGEQTPGVNFSLEQKVEIASQLACLGVDVIEAGFPAASPEAAEVVKHIALTVGNEDVEGRVPAISAIARCVKADIDTSWEAVREAKHPRLLLFVATSEIHMKHKLRMTKSQVLSVMKDALSYARSLGVQDIAFGAEDCSRSDKEFVYDVFEAAIDAGATTLIMADTVGYMFPQEWGSFTGDVMKNVKGIENVILGTHCHNDLGLATANTLAAVEAGARHVEGTINGIGERAGNVALEEVIMGIKCRGQDLLCGLHTGVNPRLLAPICQMVEEYSGLALQANKAIVGANIFSHASGIHQDGVLKHRGTYEILSPEDIGKSLSTDLGIVLSKHSGRHALHSRLRQLGLEVDDTQFEKLFSRFKEMAKTKKEFSDRDVKSLVVEKV